MLRDVLVAGVGMIPFAKPGKSDSYYVMGEKAARAALEDAGISYTAVQEAYAGYVYADSTAGQSALYPIGVTGIPIINVNNNCSTGSTALYLARQAVEYGVVDCALAVGFDQMLPGALGSCFPDRDPVLVKPAEAMVKRQGWDENAPVAAQFFGGAARDYSEKYGTKPETFGKISEKARKHAYNNPYAVFRELLTLEEIMESPQVYGLLTRYQCCPPTCGAAAAIVCSRDFAEKHGIDNAVTIRAQAMTTDFQAAFDSDNMVNVVGYDMARNAVDSVYEQAGIGPEEVDVVELHDCFTANELITYESLRLTPAGTAEQFVCDGDNTYGGKVVVNPSGGLLSKGHPIGATGLAQCTELVWQLRGQAEKRQVEGAKIGLQHNLGLGGAVVVTMYEA